MIYKIPEELMDRLKKAIDARILCEEEGDSWNDKTLEALLIELAAIKPE